MVDFHSKFMGYDNLVFSCHNGGASSQLISSCGASSQLISSFSFPKDCLAVQLAEKICKYEGGLR